MASKSRTIPIKEKKDPAQPRLRYDCSKCPGYCCSYPLIEIGKRDIARLAKHFGLGFEQAQKRFTKYDKNEKVYALRHQKDRHFGTICRFFDTRKRRCTVYEARPGVCRVYPDGTRCGYYDFLQFEREQQGDSKFVATTSNQ